MNDAGMASEAGGAPEVDLRTSGWSRVYGVVFVTAWLAFFMVVIVSAWVTHPLSWRIVFDTVLIGGLFVVGPVLGVVAGLRSGVRSFGTTLRVRAGLVTSLIPAADIDGFVILDRVGGRRAVLPDRRWFVFESPAIALRPGSPSDIAHQSVRNGPWTRRIANGLRRLGPRSAGDVALGSATSGTSPEVVIAQLATWHRWALRSSTP